VRERERERERERNEGVIITGTNSYPIQKNNA
jgi:hypothetical protein